MPERRPLILRYPFTRKQPGGHGAVRDRRCTANSGSDYVSGSGIITFGLVKLRA